MSDLWSTPGFPHRGWRCIDVIDLNPDEDPADEVDYATCDACNNHPIRFVHVIEHDNHPTIEVGCICAEKLTEDYASPRRRERELTLRASRRARWLTRAWRVSASGNHYLNIGGHNVGIFPSKFRPGGYTFRIGGRFSRQTYADARAAKLALFDVFDRMRKTDSFSA